jgi:hypothetical protein
MEEKHKNWIHCISSESVYYIPDHTWKTFDFDVEYYPLSKILIISEKGKYFDDHAVIQLVAESFTIAEHLLNYVLAVMTV